MKTYRKELSFDLPRWMGFVNITPDVAASLAESRIREGLCLVKTIGTGFLPR